MGLIIRKKKHYLTRFPVWLAIIVFCALSPAIIGLVGGWLTEISTGEPCHEGNCTWMVLPWLTVITLPVGGIILIAYLVIILIDSIKLFNENKTTRQ